MEKEEILKQIEQAKHTPGEWKVYKNTIQTYDQKGYSLGIIAQVFDWNDINVNTWESNAALIASAPTLLEENLRLQSEIELLKQQIKEAKAAGWDAAINYQCTKYAQNFDVIHNNAGVLPPNREDFINQ